jgi:hypothetical protein
LIKSRVRLPQTAVFEWSDYENSDELQRSDLILSSVPDENLLQILEKVRGPSGVDKYPIRALWNSLIAGVVYEQATIESLRRELKRNPHLLQKCGFNAFHGVKAVPSSGSYSFLIFYPENPYIA